MASMMILVLSSYSLVLLTFISPASLKASIASLAGQVLLTQPYSLPPQGMIPIAHTQAPLCASDQAEKELFPFRLHFSQPPILHTTRPCSLLLHSHGFPSPVLFFLTPGLLQWCALPLTTCQSVCLLGSAPCVLCAMQEALQICSGGRIDSVICIVST